MGELVVHAEGVPAEVMEKVVVSGDLASLSPEQRVSYYGAVCRSLGLNPLTKPFEYLQLNGKLTLYAKRDCTDQLRRIHKVSVTEVSKSVEEGVVVVTAKGRDEEGREDSAIGAVASVNAAGKPLPPEALALAFMRAETKAKRRLTLSLVGLGMLDESEVEGASSFAEPHLPPIQPPQRRSESPGEEKVDPAVGVALIEECRKRNIGQRTVAKALAHFGFHGETVEEAMKGLTAKGLEQMGEWLSQFPEKAAE